MTTHIGNLLGEWEAPGSFATSLLVPADDLEITVAGAVVDTPAGGRREGAQATTRMTATVAFSGSSS